MDKAKKTQIEKYGGEAGYREEMRRRRGLVKNPGYFDKADPAKLKEISRSGGKARWNKNASQEIQGS